MDAQQILQMTLTVKRIIIITMINVIMARRFGRCTVEPETITQDDDKFTPTKHLTPPPHHSSRPAAAHTDTETPLLHQRKG